ncbi:MAG TPA: S8 family serine peptidase, partial [Anaerolineaceae bacterium]|nr:S8 family serine peptidase [Anaerolineaceae bacterium]
MQVVLYVGMASWIVIASVIAMFGSWVVEQGLFEGSVAIPDIRWAIHLGYAAFLLLPLGVIVATIRERRANRVYFGWLLAAALAIFTVPARLLDVPDAYGAALFQIIGLGLFLFALWRISIARKPGLIGLGLRGLKPGVAIAIAVAGLSAVPWMLWGAAGSVMDVLLNLVVAALFGIVSALVLQMGVFDRPPDAEVYTGSRLALDGIGALFTLLILVTGLGQTGMQWLLPPVLATLGLVAAALNRVARASIPEDEPHWPALAWLFGLAAAVPLIWIDPDELMFIISAPPGDLLTWAIQATVAAFFIALGVGILLMLIYRQLQAARPVSRLRIAAAGFAWLAALLLYGFAGQPGLHGERLFVILNDQADVSSAAQIADIDERRSYVYRTLVDHAEAAQADLRQALERVGLAYTPYYLVNAVEVDGGPLVQLWLSSRSDVDRVLPSPRLRPLPEPLPITRGTGSAPDGTTWNIEMLAANRVWEELGVDGAGIVVGQSDSGVQGDHPELAGAYLGRENGDDYAWFDPWNQTTSPKDFGGHGTHTLGSVLGQTTGIAPGAQWIACVNLARNLGNPALYLDCMQFMLAPFPQAGDPFRDGDPLRAADVLNNSWGCPEVEGCDPQTFLPAVSALRAAGIFVAVSAGNSGYSGCGSVDSPPAIYDEVYSV